MSCFKVHFYTAASLKYHAKGGEGNHERESRSQDRAGIPAGTLPTEQFSVAKGRQLRQGYSRILSCSGR